MVLYLIHAFPIAADLRVAVSVAGAVRAITEATIARPDAAFVGAEARVLVAVV